MKVYDKIFLTNIPSFYKINLYNRIAKHIKILVIYTGHGDEGRNADFFNNKSNFESLYIGDWSKSRQLQLAYNLRRGYDYKELIIGGWDHYFFWASAILSSKKKNAVVVESSFYESNTSGIKGLIKRIFLTRISKAYVSGKSQKKLVETLGFKGNSIVTKGVGVFNYIKQPPYQPREHVKNFLYVGRFVEVKNLKFLISVFNELPDIELYLAGFGIQEKELKNMAHNNIHFLGAVDNKKLPDIYQKMDVFILPSKSETWGLVVEEALNNGLPVIVSNKVGCADEIINESNGLIFEYNSADSLKNAVLKMRNLNFYNKLRKNISKLNFELIEEEQVKKYIS